MQARISWEGDSLAVLSSFPPRVKGDFGYNLRRLQQGKDTVCTSRPMTSIGQGVFELKQQDERSWYRVIFISRIGDVIHVLHCFEKKSAKTAKRDLDTAAARLKLVKQRWQREKKRGKQ